MISASMVDKKYFPSNSSFSLGDNQKYNDVSIGRHVRCTKNIDGIYCPNNFFSFTPSMKSMSVNLVVSFPVCKQNNDVL